MATMNISLPDSMKAFVEEEVEAGGYSTTSEYFRALVRAAQNGKAKKQRESLLEGLNSSEPTLRGANVPAIADRRVALAQMAADPQIRRELAAIETEFASAEMDGLEKSER